MRTSIILLVFLNSITSAFAQDPAILWQNTIGGSEREDAREISPTSDGGYIIGGDSFSNISGDKTENSNGGRDLWIVKINATGAIVWQNTIGGSGEDRLWSIFQTVDGGYLILADSNSDISGDKTENSRGGFDYWILKLDATGTIMWQHTYGGIDADYFPRGHQTSDGSYIVAGTSTSGVSGEKTDPSNGDADIWILKLDSNGTILWQNSIGGSSGDYTNAISLANDGGYIINTSSISNISGDKSENSIGGLDYWVVKLNPDGTVQWENTIGGINDDAGFGVIPTMDGGYLAGGQSNSPASGDKSENSLGLSDYWIMKLDSSGTIVWENTIGGGLDDFFTDFKELTDGSFLVTGISYSGIGGDKTDPSKGDSDNWFLNVNSSGAITGQKTIGGTFRDDPINIILTQEGGFVVANSSSSDISGDKTENSQGFLDYWVYKMQSVMLDVSDNDLNSISLYPNPTNGNFTIEMGREYTDVSIQIYNMLGQLISSEKYVAAKTIEQKIIAPVGIYFVNVNTVKEGSNTLRIIKQ
ncbi:hypothetical protein Aeqsu_1668 [Aequorivita sublithincola DSM 14238]|uniref:Secretion system C-terminal sorting domain-containing protein n=1 Tax=Aequorivita sublithincola (strain DSM 14238 / LMG 21431 / ACAM 643 / 9-3) TaxID=746697 RepID=I3YVY3_AEQSU|nr:T9SS type A sorting domain-containing protein [Aequorivita sublithincola]AFL81151.1 hypothetical protein Aeqsu_1668 [Aequorivita sublithincola DSM 14238]